MSNKSTIMELQLDMSAVQDGVDETAAILAGLQQIAAGVGDTITQAFLPIAISLQKVQESMESLPDTLSTVTEKLNEIVTIMQEGQGGDMLTVLFGGIQTIASLGDVEEQIGSVGVALVEAMNRFGELSGVLSGLSLGWVAAIAAVIAILAILVTNWDSSTEGLQQSFTEFKDGLLATWQYIHDNIIGPIISVCGETLSTLWNNHLKPLWDNILGLVMSLAEGVLSLWNNVLKPIVDMIVKKVAPVVVNVISQIVDRVSCAMTSIVDVIRGVLVFLDGVITIIVSAFALDLQRAWTGVVKVFEGIAGAIEGYVKGVANAIIWTLNHLWSAIYSVVANIVNGLGSVVSTVGNMLGKNWGFSLPAKAPTIPYLAQGAVLPANKPFLAVVGDQKHGTNIEAPLSTIQEAVAAVMENYAAGNTAGHEATVEMLRQILEAVLGIQIGDEVIGNAVNRYNRKRAIIRGGTL